MLKTPCSRPTGQKCNALPIEALAFRKRNPELLTVEGLGRINITAWLYLDDRKMTHVTVNPNITLAQIREEFGRAPTRDAETGIHSEAIAAQFFKDNPQFQVLAIFTERFPCRKMCAPMLENYFKGIPWFYYCDRRSWRDEAGELIKRAGEILKVAYDL